MKSSNGGSPLRRIALFNALRAEDVKRGVDQDARRMEIVVQAWTAVGTATEGAGGLGAPVAGPLGRGSGAGEPEARRVRLPRLP